MPTTIGGYLTKHETCDCGGGTFLRVDMAPRTFTPSHRTPTAYYGDEYGNTLFTPCVARLSHGRMLPGWTLGEGMSTGFAPNVYTDERDAWDAAHHMAEHDAEEERDYRASRCSECYEEQRRGYGESPELCESCYLDSGSRTLAMHATE